MNSRSDLVTKRNYSKEIAEDPNDLMFNKRGKVLDDFDSFSIIGSNDADSSADQLSNLAQSFSDDDQSLSSALAEQRDMNDFAESIHILGEAQSCLHEEVVLVNETVTKLNKKISEQQNQIDSLIRLVQQTVEINKSLQKRNETLADELKTVKKISDTSSISAHSNGTYLWKITDFTEKLADAVAEKQTSIYSPPFYSSPMGYKMCMRLYLQGDGQARRTHLSLFFVILRGENDAVLPWPFTHRVTFCLLDQTPAQRHVVDSFRPDPTSNSFQRPRSEMNIASGIPKFFPLNIVQQSNNPYVRDDSMFIRCVVNFDTIPKQSLNKICTLNLALPLLVREKEIQEIISKTNANGNGQEVESGRENKCSLEVNSHTMEIEIDS